MEAPTSTIESKQEAYESPQALWRFWMDAIEVAAEQEKDWVEQADHAAKLYRGELNKSFNILHSNVAVKVPAIYNSKPEPDVRPRDQSNKDPQQTEAARLAAQALDLALRYQLDEYDFDALARAVVKDSQIAGRGVARVEWKTYMGTDLETRGQLVWEEATCKRVPWRFFKRGPANSWAEVRWVAYEHALTKDQIISLAGPDIAEAISYDVSDVSEKVKDGKVREKTVFQKATVHEVWDADSRSILFVAPGYDKGPLKVEGDPYGLVEFFDCEVLQSLTDPDSLNPICPYTIYREQAEELARISERILGLITALKWAGIRAGEIPELDKLDDLQDGEFLVSTGAMALVQGAKGLADAIWFVPVAELAATLKELLLQREQIKQTIYELTGISDIMRGATDPNETLGAQNIKAQAGSLRAHDEQADAEKWCRGILRKKAQIIANKFSPETLSAIVGEELQEQVKVILRHDALRRYLIDVETNSTVRADLAKNQEAMAGFMQASGMFIQTFVPLMQSGMFPPELAMAAITVYGAFAKQFKLGKVVDDTLAMLEQAAQKWMASKNEEDPQAEQDKEEARQLEKRGAYATVAEQEGKAKKLMAEAAKIEAETGVIPITQKTKLVHEMVDTDKQIEETRKSREEVEAQKVETAQQATELEFKRRRGPFSPDPTEVARERIRGDTAVRTGQQKADASVESAKQKSKPDFDGFVQ